MLLTGYKQRYQLEWSQNLVSELEVSLVVAVSYFIQVEAKFQLLRNKQHPMENSHLVGNPKLGERQAMSESTKARKKKSSKFWSLSNIQIIR